MVDRSVGTVRVEGTRTLRRTLKAAGDDLADLKAAHKESAQIATTAAKPLTPVRSGRLASTLRASGTKTAGVMRAGKAKAPHAGPIHWGWPRRGIKATPFLSEGAQQSESTWIAVYNKAIESALQKIKGA